MNYRRSVLPIFLALSTASIALAAEPPSLAKVVPADALLYVEIGDWDLLKQGLDQTPLGAVISTEKPGAGVGLLMNLAKLGLKTYSGAPIEEWLAHFDRSLAFSVLALKGPRDAGEPPLVFLARLKKGGAEFRKFLEEKAIPSLLNLVPEMEHQSLPEGEHVIETIRNTKDKKSFHFSILDDVLVLGGPNGLRKFLATYGAQPVLADDESYLATRKKALATPHLWSYFNAPQALRRVFEEADGNPEKRRGLRVGGVASLAEIATSLRIEDGAARERAFLRRGAVDPEGLALAFTQPKPRALKGAQFVPTSFPLGVCVNLESGKAFRQAVEDTVRQVIGPEAADRFGQVRQFFQDGLGVNLDLEVWANLTGELVFAMEIPGLRESLLARADLPPKKEWRFLFALSIENREIIWNAFKKALGSEAAWQGGFTHETTEKGEAQILEVKHRGRNMTFAFLKDFLIFSNSTDVVLSSLQAQAEKRSVADDAIFKERLALHPDGQNLIVHFDVRRVTAELRDVLEQFGHPMASLILKELQPVIAKLGAATAVGTAQDDGFTLDVYSSEGAAIHFLGVAALIDALKKSPGGRVVRARRDLDRITQAIDSYFIDNGSFPPDLEALKAKYLKQMPKDPFGWQPYQYHPGPVTKENERELYVTSWLLVSRGPDERQDLNVAEIDPPTLRKRLNSGAPEDEDYLRRVTYQYRPDKYKLEDRILDRGDIYVLGTPPR